MSTPAIDQRTIVRAHYSTYFLPPSTWRAYEPTSWAATAKTVGSVEVCKRVASSLDNLNPSKSKQVSFDNDCKQVVKSTVLKYSYRSISNLSSLNRRAFSSQKRSERWTGLHWRLPLRSSPAYCSNELHLKKFQ